MLGFGITGVQRVYDGDPEWSPPTTVGADGSFQPAVGPHGPQAVFEYGWRLHVACWPGNCCQTCDKSLCGFFFDGCLSRWAVAHFGQALPAVQEDRDCSDGASKVAASVAFISLPFMAAM